MHNSELAAICVKTCIHTVLARVSLCGIFQTSSGWSFLFIFKPCVLNLRLGHLQIGVTILQSHLTQVQLSLFIIAIYHKSFRQTRGWNNIFWTLHLRDIQSWHSYKLETLLLAWLASLARTTLYHVVTTVGECNPLHVMDYFLKK
jgi:hypothetical protein